MENYKKTQDRKNVSFQPNHANDNIAQFFARIQEVIYNILLFFLFYNLAGHDQ